MQRDLDRTDLRLEDLLAEVFQKEFESEKIKTGAAIGKGDKLSLYKQRSRRAQEYWESFKHKLPGYIMASCLSQYHRQKIRNKPSLYKAIKHEECWFIPLDVANNLPQEKRGPKVKQK